MDLLPRDERVRVGEDPPDVGRLPGIGPARLVVGKTGAGPGPGFGRGGHEPGVEDLVHEDGDVVGEGDLVGAAGCAGGKQAEAFDGEAGGEDPAAFVQAQAARVQAEGGVAPGYDVGGVGPAEGDQVLADHGARSVAQAGAADPQVRVGAGAEDGGEVTGGPQGGRVGTGQHVGEERGVHE